ncbi:uncharacterized protein LOC141830314 [Curcuma longa]|uniref:uncharacterized protein LOC141830314 n=1 Tax=Curcuma longa TaxID=136217 RepID=UPI003D9F8B99
MTYRCEQEESASEEDRLTSLSEDLLIFIQSNFLSIKHRVALSAVCSRFRDLLPSIPRLDTFRLDVGSPSGGVDIHQELTFPRALIRQCHIVFHDNADLPNRLKQLLVEGLVEAGVQDLILEASQYWHYDRLNLNGGDSGFFSITSLRILCLRRICLCEHFYHHPSSPLGCAFLTTIKIEFCVLRDDFLRNLFAFCPFLETLQLVCCYGLNRDIDKLSIHSASLKHLVLYMNPYVRAINVCCPKLESLVVNVVNKLHIEAPKVRTASLLLAFMQWKDPSVALKNLFRAPFLKGFFCLMLNSSTAQNVIEAQKVRGDRSIKLIRLKGREDHMIFNLHFNLKDPSSTTILAELMKKCNNCNNEFDIWADSTHIESTNENNHLLHGSTGLELINLQMAMPEKRFKGFLSNQKKMKKFKHTGLELLRRRTSKEQFIGILASEESLFQVSSNMANIIEMKI